MSTIVINKKTGSQELPDVHSYSISSNFLVVTQKKIERDSKNKPWVVLHNELFELKDIKSFSQKFETEEYPELNEQING